MEMGSSYAPMAPSKLKIVVDRVAKKLKKLQKKVPFDTIVFRGNSGACVAFPLAYKMQIPVVFCRKEREIVPSHGDAFEGSGNMVNYVILDDFISSGETVKEIYKKVQALAKDRQCVDVKCVGIVLYAENAGRKEYAMNAKVTLPVFSFGGE